MVGLLRSFSYRPIEMKHGTHGPNEGWLCRIFFVWLNEGMEETRALGCIKLCVGVIML